jgi:hypothetical protein
MPMFLAIDQYGNHEWINAHPRKELMERMGVQHADRIYIDTEEGKTYHIGYAISGHWFTLYEVEPYRKEV